MTSRSPAPSGRRFDAILFDAGGVLVLPDPGVLGPLLGYYGGDPSVEVHRRAHYAAMKAKADADAPETSWVEYDERYVTEVGVAAPDRTEAAAVLGLTRNSHHWRFPIADTRVALDRLADAGIPMGVVSNAQGQIEAMLRRHTCQVGPGDHVEMRVIVDSEVVGVAKPDPRIFDHALPAFEGLDPGRIAYVGDSVTMDVAAASAAGLHPILIDPFDDHAGAAFERVRAVTDLADELC